MSPIAPVIAELSATIAAASVRLGERVEVEGLGVIDRAGHLPLAEPGLVSPNGACQLHRAADGWIALNLARPEDRELLPAWFGEALATVEPGAIAALAARRSCGEMVERAELLGLPVAQVGEVRRSSPAAGRHELGPATPTPRSAADLEVLDLGVLWAGPLCGAVLAAAGARVTRVESLRRPDPSRHSTPEFFRRLNGAKAELALDLATEAGRRRLDAAILDADVVITSARPRGLESLGLSPEAFLEARQGRVWVAITGYGFFGQQRQRVAFGDDAAAAGGLVRWSSSGEPCFLGDALADPVTGLAAAAGALEAVLAGGGILVDASLAGCAAGAAARLAPVHRAGETVGPAPGRGSIYSPLDIKPKAARIYAPE